MLGFLLLLIALGLYFNRSYRYISLFLYISFMLGYGGGFGLWNNEVLGVKTMDLALIYTFAINGFLLVTWQNPFRPFKGHKHFWLISYIVVVVFLMCSAVFSYVHYQFTPYQILQGGRSYLLILSLPILARAKPWELQRIMELCFWITVITSVLYILQIIVGHPLMPYSSNGYSYESSTGLVRLYNYPALLNFFLITSFICPRFFQGNVNVYRVIFFAALMCTQGRTGIFSGLLGVVLATVLVGRASTFMKTVVIIGIMFLPFMDMVSQRFEKGNTGKDVVNVLEGGATEYSGGDGTFTYRWAWIYERYDYLKDRPLGEKMFGLGLISGSQPVVYKMYRFQTGLINEYGEIHQLNTPDTSYGNLLSNLGFVGMFLYLVFCVSLAFFLYRHRKEFPIVAICASRFIVMFIGSMSGSALSEPRNFAIFFLAVSLLYKRKVSSRLLNRDSKWLFVNNRR